MDNFNTSNESSKPNFFYILGLMLMVVGVGVILFVGNEAYKLYNDIDSNPFLTQMLNYFTDVRFLSFGGETITLDAGAAMLVSTMLFIFFASMGIRLAFALIRGGAQLASPESNTQIENIKARLAKLSAELKNKQGR